MIRDMQKGLVPASPSLAGYYALDAARLSQTSKTAGVTSPGWLSAMNQVPLFSELDGRHLAKVMKLAVLRRYGAGSVLVRTAAPGDAFHIILDGRARVDTPRGTSGSSSPATGSASLP